MLKSIPTLIAMASLYLTTGSCQPQTEVSLGNIPYDLTEHDDKQKLDGKLEEISGLSAISKNKVACVQDEKGNIYIYNIKKEEIVDKIDFFNSGDYEGIEILGSTAWVVESDGDLYQVKDYESKDRKTKKYETYLSIKNDVEGLGYDPTRHYLLLACKAKPGKGKDYKGKKAIYAFDLKKRELKEKPYYLIDLEDLRNQLKSKSMRQRYEKLAEAFGFDEGSLTFQPSGIAVHPVTGNIYIIASVGKLILVLNKKGKVIAFEALDPKKFKQPEGITFMPNGDLVLSNEGQKGKANILVFKYQTDETN